MSADIPGFEIADGLREAEATADLIQKLQVAGHAVHADKAGWYTATRWGQSRHCMDFDSLHDFARQLGVV